MLLRRGGGSWGRSEGPAPGKGLALRGVLGAGEENRTGQTALLCEKGHPQPAAIVLGQRRPSAQLSRRLITPFCLAAHPAKILGSPSPPSLCLKVGTSPGPIASPV